MWVVPFIPLKYFAADMPQNHVKEKGRKFFEYFRPQNELWNFFETIFESTALPSLVLSLRLFFRVQQ